mgnify:FL=1|jgi:hypothetical protein
MADDKQGRDEQADREEKRQREREVEETQTRSDEEEPMRVDPGEELGDLDKALKSHDYPVTTNELTEAYGDYEVETSSGKKSLEGVFSTTDDQVYDSVDEVRRDILDLIGRYRNDLEELIELFELSDCNLRID